jgi:hypothetical protein
MSRRRKRTVGLGAEILKKHYFVKERIRIRSIGIQTVSQEKKWIAVQ